MIFLVILAYNSLVIDFRGNHENILLLYFRISKYNKYLQHRACVKTVLTKFSKTMNHFKFCNSFVLQKLERQYVRKILGIEVI